MTINQLNCQRCNHIWIPRIEPVKECPKCKSRIWNKPKSISELFKQMFGGLNGKTKNVS
ncbi:MAG: hypothetical protein AABX23_04795 [Nanoarchaeota archaeon]